MIIAGGLWLIAGGLLSLVAAILHLGCIVGGADWYRFFGAGESMANRAARGDSYPTIVTLLIAAVLTIWSLYAFSGAGLIPRLPLLRLALVLICAVYLARALLWVPGKVFTGRPIAAFDVWSSLIVLVYGATYAIGTAAAWSRLARG